jgi:hypothetical protein
MFFETPPTMVFTLTTWLDKVWHAAGTHVAGTLASDLAMK